MTGGTSAAVLRQFRTLYEAGTVAGMTDGQLLERFFGGRGEEAEVAFAAILARHGSMVLGVCRRALRDPNDADDAFQATFLILVRKGRSVRVEDSLGRWLYGVSRKVAARARSDSERRRGSGLGAVADLPGPGGEAERLDLRALLDDELAALAEPFRSAVVLCDLGGLSLEEAARDLRCPVGTIKSRLARGRERLRVRLTRRGLAPSTAILAVEGPTPAALIEATVRSIARFACSGKIEAGMVPASALSLAEGILRAMTLIKLKFAAAALTCGIAAAGAGAFAQQGAAPGAKPAFQRKAVQFSKPVNAAAAMERKLDEPVTFDFKRVALKQAVQMLQDLTGLSIGLAPATPGGPGVDPESNVTLKGESIRLRVALEQLLRPLKLAFLVKDEYILIVPAEPQEAGGPAKPAAESKAVGERGTAKVPAGWNRKLDRLVTFSWEQAGLDYIVLWLKSETGLNVVLDPKMLDDPRFHRDGKVTLKVDPVPIRQALGLILEPLGLTYRFDEDVLLITLPSPAQEAAPAYLPREVVMLRQMLAQSHFEARKGDDPAVARRSAELEAVEGAVANLGKNASNIPDAPNPPNPEPTGPKPPREMSKVSMPDYVVEPPDIIVVEVLEALPGRPITGERLVMPDGKISLGFYGEVYVAGLTVNEAKAKVVQHLRRYLKDDVLGLAEIDKESGKVRTIAPGDTTKVFVSVAAYNSKVYYVQGDVGTPGRLPITGNETVLDAINYAGGLVPTSSKTNIRLVRPAAPGTTTGDLALPVDLKAIIERGDSKTNYQLFPGDRLVVFRDPEFKLPAPGGDQEARLRELERKIDLILKKLEIPAEVK